jgi:oligopeptidase B
MRDRREARLVGGVLWAPLLASVCLGGTVLSHWATEERGAQETPQEILPPVAKIAPTRLEAYGHVRIDNYFWLQDRENPEVIAYLEAENAHTEAMMARTEALQETLFQEISGRVRETDLSVPWRQGDYFHYYRHEEGKEYPIYARKRGSLEADEEILIDVNEIAEGHAYTAVRFPTLSPNQEIMAFAVDTVGRHYSTIRFKDLGTGEFLDDVIDSVTANMAWANDGRTLFYAKQTRPPVNPRPYQIYRHVLGTDPIEDELVHEEERSRCLVWPRNGYLVIETWGPWGNEWRYLDADQPDGAFNLFLPRQPGHDYSFVPVGDYFYIRTNHGGAQNFKLMRTPVSETGVEHWEEVIPHREDVLLEGFEVFRDHLVVVERREGVVHVWIRPWSGEGEYYLDFGEPVYHANILRSDPESNILRYQYSSFTTPTSVYDYNMDTREQELVKREEVLGDFDPAEYVSERLHAPARDGVSVPVSIVYRKGTRRDGASHLLLYGYGGATVDAAFDPPVLSLLDRGFIYAIAHVRGGEEMGSQWAEDGQGLKKRNTFTDFIAVAEFLISEGYASPDRLFAHGISSGGLLMGAVANMRPDLFKGIVAQVPNVDVLASFMSNTAVSGSGDPQQEAYYRYVLSYSPYENVRRQDYPNMLVTAALHDTQVQYWAPTKWVAKLRALKTDDNVLLLQMNMEGEHGGSSGRYQGWREIAFRYAFILDLAGIAE